MADPYEFCPRSYNCANQSDFVSFDIGPVPTYVSLVSSGFSCAGAALILVSHYALPKHMRTTIRCIITLLAMADLFNALGYAVGSINYLHFFGVRGERCALFDQVCTIQSFITTTASLFSYFWTSILTLHFYLVIEFDLPRQRGSDVLAVYNAVVWLAPLVLSLTYLATDRLGFSPYGASNWCFVRDRATDLEERETAALALAGPVWVMLAYAVIITFSLIVLCKLRQTEVRWRSTAVYTWCKLKLLFIPLFFVLLKIWGTLQFFVSVSLPRDSVHAIATNSGDVDYCIHSRLQTVFFVLGVLQAVGAAGQGWVNTILYIVLFPHARDTLVCRPLAQLCARCFTCLSRHMGEDLDYVVTRRSSVLQVNNQPVPGYVTGQLGGSGAILPVQNGTPEHNSLVETRSETGSIPTILAITDL